MLKIKDSVDLKELEKFGLELGNSWHMDCYNCEGEDLYSFYSIDIIPKTREIYCTICTDEDCSVHITGLPNLLFDLIQAGYIEKVEE